MEYYEKRDTCPNLENEKKTYKSASEIQNFYRGKKIFITGGSGFLGSLVVEKLLRSCPDIGKIYILLRDKKEKTPKERLETLFDNEIFHLVKRKGRNYIMSKVSCVVGDCELPNCGMSEESVKMIKNEVDIVLHIAACLNMDAHIKKAFIMNVAATRDLLEMATQMKKLKAFVYCSTAYSQANHKYIEEKFYVPGLKHFELETLLESMNEWEAAAISQNLIGQWNNTYAFTKAVAEDLVKDYKDKIPVVVARPSIVIGCHREPLKAWINNVYGVTGVTTAAFAGLLHVWCCDKDKIADIIPADYCANALTAIPWDIVCNKTSDKNVYNITCDSRNYTTWGEYMYLVSKYGMEDCTFTKLSISEIFLHLEKRVWLFYLMLLSFHVLKGLVFDSVAIITRQKPKLINVYIKLLHFNKIIMPYGLSEWFYERTNYDRMSNAMTDQDKDIFYLDLSNYDWNEYHQATIRGIRLYLLKDTFDSISYARKRYKMLYYVRVALTSTVGFYILHKLIY